MNKRKWNYKSLNPWHIIFLITIIFLLFLIWIATPNNFINFIGVIILYTIIALSIGCWSTWRKNTLQISKLQDLIIEPTAENTQQIMDLTANQWHPLINQLAKEFQQYNSLKNSSEVQLREYQEYIEAWTHEIKTPLSVALLVLNNHDDEISPYVYQQLTHAHDAISDDVEQILYYARLNSPHVDYHFEKIKLVDCIEECLEKFSLLAKEKNTQINIDLKAPNITSDKRVLIFILSQVLNNAFKYTKEQHGIVEITSWEKADNIYLAIRNNGKAVNVADKPFLFDKGFTGIHSKRQNATGMGLYFVKKYADLLAIDVEIEAKLPPNYAFGIKFAFPVI